MPIPQHHMLKSRPMKKSLHGHPMVKGDSAIKYPHGPSAMVGLQDSSNKPSPGMPAPSGGAPKQSPGVPFGGKINSSIGADIDD